MGFNYPELTLLGSTGSIGTQALELAAAKNIKVNTLCAKLNISKNILYEHFKYTLETTVCDYITERRIIKAKKLLSSTEKTILFIAEECGINNYTYFIKLFKKQTGITPYQYRINNSDKKKGM